MANHSRSKCMETGCDKPPEHQCLWAEGKARAWFCSAHWEGWVKERRKDDDIVADKEVKDGQVGKNWSYEAKSHEYKNRNGADLSLMDPMFNVREICKQLLLLEDHLAHENKQCPDCISKHLLAAEAFAEEATTLDDTGEYGEFTEQIADVIRKAQEALTDDANRHRVLQGLRRLRKALVAVVEGRATFVSTGRAARTTRIARRLTRSVMAGAAWDMVMPESESFKSGSTTLEVYRIDSGDRKFADVNAANFEGLKTFLAKMNISVDDSWLTKYVIVADEPLVRYSHYNRGSPLRDLPRVNADHVGVVEKGRAVWYSFPRNGAWKIQQKKGPVPLSFLMEKGRLSQAMFRRLGL